MSKFHQELREMGDDFDEHMKSLMCVAIRTPDRDSRPPTPIPEDEFMDFTSPCRVSFFYYYSLNKYLIIISLQEESKSYHSPYKNESPEKTPAQLNLQSLSSEEEVKEIMESFVRILKLIEFSD